MGSNVVKVFDLRYLDKDPVCTFEAAANVSHVAFDSKGLFVSVAAGNVVDVWNPKKGKATKLTSFENDAQVNVAKFAASGDFLATGGELSHINFYTAA